MVMKVRTKFEVPRLDRERYLKHIERPALETLGHAALEFIQAAVSVIPVWSGASRATFHDLAREIGTTIDSTPEPNAPDRRGLGESSTNTGFSSSNGKFSFYYDTKLPHLLYNDENNANQRPDQDLFGVLKNPGPYGFRELAREAAEDVLSGFQPQITVSAFFKNVRVKG